MRSRFPPGHTDKMTRGKQRLAAAEAVSPRVPVLKRTYVSPDGTVRTHVRRTPGGRLVEVDVAQQRSEVEVNGMVFVPEQDTSPSPGRAWFCNVDEDFKEAFVSLPECGQVNASTISSDGTRAYVVNRDYPFTSQNGVYVIDTATPSLVKTYPAPYSEPTGCQISNEGDVLYVAGYDGGLAGINPETGTILASNSFGSFGLVQFQMDPSGEFMDIGTSGGTGLPKSYRLALPSLGVVSSASYATLSDFPYTRLIGTTVDGLSCVTAFFGNQLRVMDGTAIVRTFSVNDAGCAVSQNGEHIYIPYGAGDGLAVYDASTFEFIREILLSAGLGGGIYEVRTSLQPEV